MSIKTGGVRPLPELPYPPDEGSTHWEGCWSTRRHHNCAVAEITRLKAENERLRKALERARDLPHESYCAVWCDCAEKVQDIARTALSTTTREEDDG